MRDCIKECIYHFSTPRHTNNHRSKLLHHSSLLFFISFFIAGSVLFLVINNTRSDVLGVSVDVSVQELLLYTNQQRNEEGIPSLVLNDQLSRAAELKAYNMLEKNYWAHTSPDGVTPWYFIKKVGYDYKYAGENLARGFNTASDVVNAWMDSKTHRKNILSKDYKDIGFAIQTGMLNGEETVLIVEMFGNTGFPTLVKESTKDSKGISIISDSSLNNKTYSLNRVEKMSIVNSIFLSKTLAFIIITLLVLVLFIDLIIIERKKIIRVVGHNLDHIFFFSAVLITVIIVGKGIIL